MKRVLTTVIGLPIVIAFFVLSNQYIIDVLFAILLILAMHEYFGCIKNGVKPVQWIGYLMAVFVAFLHIIPFNIMKNIAIMAIPTILTILYGMKGNSPTENGKILIWYIFLASWGSDVFAYLIGRHGTHKFSKVSPNKTIEGCVAGVVAAVILSIIYTIIIQKVMNITLLPLPLTGAIAAILSVLGQIGDFAASSIKRNFKVKDFSNLIPGHGGIIDRIDSVIFMAPFAYFLFIILF